MIFAGVIPREAPGTDLPAAVAGVLGKGRPRDLDLSSGLRSKLSI